MASAKKGFFMAHHVDFVNCLNVDEVIPFLNKQQLLTPDEMETLYFHQTRGKKIGYLVGIMGTKGYRAPSLFIECVRDAKKHIAHPELADKMEKWLQIDLPAGTPINCSEKDLENPIPQKLQQRPSTPIQSSSVISVIDVNVIRVQRGRPVEHEKIHNNYSAEHPDFNHKTKHFNRTHHRIKLRVTAH